MDLEETTRKIILLPIEFRKVGNDKSIYSLLKETQYFNVYNKISESNILKELDNHDEYINCWLSWSQDKRSNEGWYFLRKENNKYVVGYMRSDGKKEEYKEFDNAINACAAYIKREIETIRQG